MNEEIQIVMDNKPLPQAVILEWEYRRLLACSKVIKKIKQVELASEFPSWVQARALDQMRAEVLRVKLLIGMDDFKVYFRKRTALGNGLSNLAARLSFGKRTLSVTDFYVPYSNKTPEEVVNKLTDLMMINTERHLKINLNTNSDHYVLRSVSDRVQEVLEYTGGSPLPTNFYAHYGESEGLQSVLSEGDTAQIAGTAKLRNGAIIGGVRHQVKKEATGFSFKAVVEFPALVPVFMIKQHQLHLACEFSHWLSEV